jgi:hypothetical protein
MIPNENEFQFATKIRQKIIDMLAGIENATWDQFNDQSPNWLTRSRMRSLIDEFEKGLVSLGAKPVRAYADCGHADHEKLAVWKLGNKVGYWRYVFDDGRTDSDLVDGDELLIDGTVFDSHFESMIGDQRPTRDPCPCNPRTRKELNASRFFAWPRDPQSRTSELCRLIFFLRDALGLSEDKRPRAAIREALMHALISLERLMVPVDVDEEINKRRTR